MANRSISEIFTDLLSQFTTLLRKESQLARAEMSEKISQVATALALIVGGAVLLIPALVILLQAGVSALTTSHTIAEPYASLIVGGAASVEIFDPHAGTFRQVDGTLDTARFNPATIKVMDGSVRIFGGYDDKGATRKSWIYRP